MKSGGLAASGTLALTATIDVMQEGRLIPTLHLDNMDELCDKTRHVFIPQNSPIRNAI